MNYSDPHPELRCRCVSRRQLPLDDFPDYQQPDPYYDRCRRRATREDGLCDLCRDAEEIHPQAEYWYYLLDGPRTEWVDYKSI